MFKRPDNTTASRGSEKSEPVSGRADASSWRDVLMSDTAGSSRSDTASTIINQDTRVEGKLQSKRKIQVDGEVAGEIHCDALDVGSSARVIGDVWTNDAHISGRLEGKLFADTVSLYSTSHVIGDIEHMSLSLEQGAEFEGSSRRRPEKAVGATKMPAMPTTAKTAAKTQNSNDNFAAGYFENIREYAASFDQKASETIVAYLGKGVLSQKDASLVACSDPLELARVRDNFCKKKLMLTMSDKDIDTILADVCKAMSSERNKSRVTFYYLVAEKTGKLTALH